MNRRLIGVALLGTGFCLALGTVPAQAHDRFSFGLSIWGPPPIYVGPPCCYEPYYPLPVVVRRVYVPTPPPETVYVTPAPATSRRTKKADPVLVKIGELHSDDHDVREDAAKWLGDARDLRSLRPLIEVLQHDPNHDVREEAARALGQIGGQEAEQVLTTASVSDRDKDVRRAASKALSRMAKESTKRVVR